MGLKEKVTRFAGQAGWARNIELLGIFFSEIKIDIIKKL